MFKASHQSENKKAIYIFTKSVMMFKASHPSGNKKRPLCCDPQATSSTGRGLAIQPGAWTIMMKRMKEVKKMKKGKTDEEGMSQLILRHLLSLTLIMKKMKEV